MIKDYTLKETFELLGFNPKLEPLCKSMAKDILSRSTGEPDWLYKRVEVRERSDGCPELVISIPFGIEGH